MRRPRTGMGASALFLLGYGGRPSTRQDSRTISISPTRIFASGAFTRFSKAARGGLTDPVEFLTRLHYRGDSMQTPGHRRRSPTAGRSPL